MLHPRLKRGNDRTISRKFVIQVNHGTPERRDWSDGGFLDDRRRPLTYHSAEEAEDDLQELIDSQPEGWRPEYRIVKKEIVWV